MKPFLKLHKSGKFAVNETTKNNVTAVKVKTWNNDSLKSIDFYSYRTKWDGNPETLREDFPLPLGSNQSIEEIDANDYI